MNLYALYSNHSLRFEFVSNQAWHGLSGLLVSLDSVDVLGKKLLVLASCLPACTEGFIIFHVPPVQFLFVLICIQTLNIIVLFVEDIRNLRISLKVVFVPNGSSCAYILICTFVLNDGRFDFKH